MIILINERFNYASVRALMIPFSTDILSWVQA